MSADNAKDTDVVPVLLSGIIVACLVREHTATIMYVDICCWFLVAILPGLMSSLTGPARSI